MLRKSLKARISSTHQQNGVAGLGVFHLLFGAFVAVGDVDGFAALEQEVIGKVTGADVAGDGAAGVVDFAEEHHVVFTVVVKVLGAERLRDKFHKVFAQEPRGAKAVRLEPGDDAALGKVLGAPDACGNLCWIVGEVVHESHAVEGP